jgi:hypothetical protein
MTLIQRIQKNIINDYNLKNFKVTRLRNKNIKFNKNNFHFIIKHSKKKYFLKRIPLANISRVKNEMKNYKRISCSIKIPKIILTKNNKKYINPDNDNNYIYIMYEYIDSSANNFKEELFFNIICDVFNNLRVIESFNTSYDFKKHNINFLNKINLITDVLNNDDQFFNANEKRYIKFLRLKSEIYYKKIKHLKITQQLIHGDLIPQNILFGSDSYFIIDWENIKNYIGVIDIVRSITFFIFDKNKVNLGLNISTFVFWLRYCLNKIKINSSEKKYILELYLFHILTYTSFLERFYLEKQDLNPIRMKQDYIMCRWFIKNYDKIKLKLHE